MAAPDRSRFAAEYVLPLRWDTDDDFDELTSYLVRLSEWIDVTIVDGSREELFVAHRAAWSGIQHIAPAVPGLNGKACGALTGILAARHDHVVVADDDVRYERDELVAILERLSRYHFVRPQNVFVPAPWHARWDTGRILLNRAAGGDFAGSVAVRRSALPDYGYDTSVLFENLELERTVIASGGDIAVARELCIARRPASTRRFVEQRVRQAYDDFAQPGRLARELAVLPLLMGLLRAGRPRVLLAFAVCVVLVAAAGRARDGGRVHFRASDCLWAPMWLLERSVTVWVAVGLRLSGGVRYRGDRIRVAAHSVRALRRRGPTRRESPA